MKRKKKPKKLNWEIPKGAPADAILSGDWHLQDSHPVARKDNFFETQWEKLDFISELQKYHNCDVYHSGDLFEFWKPSPMLISKALEHIPDRFWSVAGNHCLPQHNYDLINKSGLWTLFTAGKLGLLMQGNWNQDVNTFDKWENPSIKDREILVWHIMTYQGQKPYPGCKDTKATGLLRKHPQYDLIVTGHNHIPFVEEFKGRLLVNPGSIFRTTAAQIEHRPRVYLWYADTNTVKPVYIPIEKDVISREHIERTEERNQRIDAFIETFSDDWEAQMSFEDNIEIFKTEHMVKKPVMQIIYEALENEKN
jgi:predicted phosphodiesterase